ncbi:hypothetical protein RJT34_04834 [Clitoria ternatea]|uniref:ADP-ribosyl cyclase/cyclic ADP-ribose hydrolase n=1 Tax=Clitoria ternatea TaxID=43366 RepID=A0AAN9KM08_CLITE
MSASSSSTSPPQIKHEVDPSTVRHQHGSYADAFVKHEQRCNHSLIHSWKLALTQAAELSGWDSNIYSSEYELELVEGIAKDIQALLANGQPGTVTYWVPHGYEYQLVQEIVNDIFTKVNLSFQTSSNTQSEGLVGIQKHIEQIQNMLQLDSPAVKIIGIWGIGGIGKSTIAAAAYHKLATQFQSSALVLDVQKEIERHGIYQGTDAVKCMFLDMCQIKEVQLDPQTFKMMDNLRALNFYDRIQDSKLHMPSFLESLPDELRFLCWDGFPQGSLPPDFSPGNLVELHMRDSKLEQLWERDQHLPNLKILDLSRSRKLRQIPDLARCPNIEQVILMHCKELNQVYSSGFLSKLICILLKGCTNLRNLHIPSNVLSTSYGLMDLEECLNLETFSVSMETMWVPLSGCSRYWTSTRKPLACRLIIPRLLLFGRVLKPALSLSRKEDCSLNLSYCESLTSLPTHLCKLKFLRTLNLCGCSNLEKFPEIEEPMENLIELILDKSAIRELPLSLNHLVGLQRLSLRMCRMLEFIPPSIGSLTKLYMLDLTYCESLKALPSNIFKLKLTNLSLRSCAMLRRTFPDILEPSETFSEIILTNTAIKEVPPSMDYLVGLKTLRLNLCSDLELLPNSIVNLKHLTELDCSGCGKLTEIPNDIGSLSSLRELSLVGSGIVNLPESIVHLSSLKLLDLTDCKRLECIPQLPQFLRKLLACNCSSLRTVMPNSRIEKLPSDSEENDFEFCLTTNEELDLSGHSNIVADSRHRITEDAYRSVFFCFPGSAVPDWFHCRGSGRLVTMNMDFRNRRNKLIGFALCVVLGTLDVE